MNGYEKLRKQRDDVSRQYRELLEKVGKYLENPHSEEGKTIEAELKASILQQTLYSKYPKYAMSKLLEALSTPDDDLYSWVVTDTPK